MAPPTAPRTSEFGLKEMTVAEKIELMEKLWEELSLKRLLSLNGR
jgi:hypothetical protein